MGTTSRQITALAEARGATRDETKSAMRDDAAILGEVLDRMNVIEAKQSRPSPVRLQTWEEIERFAEKAARSGMVPKDFIGKPDAICIAIQMGSELGLPPMQSLQNIAVVNGRPSIWGDAMPALCRASGMMRGMREWHEGEGDNLTFYCEAYRKDDQNPILGSFSVADAKKANLWKTEPKVTKHGRDGPYQVDSGPWYSYPHRMLQMRARGFCLRDAFPDVLRGLISAEEAADIPFEATGLTPRVEAEKAASDDTKHGPFPSKNQGDDERRELSWLEQLDEKLAAESNGTKWLKLFDAELALIQTKDDAEGVAGLPTVRAAYEKAPELIKDRINDIMLKAIARFNVPDEPDFMSPETESV